MSDVKRLEKIAHGWFATHRRSVRAVRRWQRRIWKAAERDAKQKAA